MITIYKLLNPNTGQYTDFTSADNLAAGMAKIAFDFFLLHTHNSPYVVVEVDEQGNSVWRDPQGEQILGPGQAEKNILDVATEYVEKATTAYKEAPTKYNAKVFK